MSSDSNLETDLELEQEQSRLEQIELEAKATRLEAEAKALKAKLAARKAAAKQRAAEPVAAATAPSTKQSAGSTASPPPRKNKPQEVAAKAEPKASVPKPKQAAVVAAPVTPAAQQATGAKPKSPELTPYADSPKVTAPAKTEEDDDEAPAEHQGPTLVSRLLSTTPSYLISAVLHLVTLLVLALIMLPSPEDMVKQLIVSASTLEEEDPIEELIIETPEQQLENIELEEPVEAVPIDVADPGAAALGAIAQDIPTEVSTYGVAMNDTEIDNIGALFGNEGEGMADSLEGAGGAEFFGVKASGRRFVFVVDSSLSMKNGKFEAACEELMYSLARLSKDQYFYVLFFDHDAARMTFPGKDKPEPRAVPATRENINNTGRWVRTVELELRTDPFDCIEFALELNPDAIYILTDGKFTDRGRTVKYLAKENLFEDPIDGTLPKSVIHTVGFYQRDGESTLMPLAKKHGGTYRFVPDPRKKN